MPSATQSLLYLAPLAAIAQAAVIVVEVGQGGLTFTPNSITAAVGDQVEFQFASGHHAVTQGDFANPCQPISDNAFNSGVVMSTGGPPFTVTINNTDPIYYYCPVPQHCQLGMAAAINAPSNASAEDYITASKSTKSSGSIQGVQGGVFAEASNSTSSSSSSSASSSSTMSSSGTMTSATTSATTSASSTGSGSGSTSSSTSQSSASTFYASALLAIPAAILAALQL